MGGMVFDFNGWLLRFENGTIIDALKGFGYFGLHQVENVAFFTLYKLFGVNYWGWYVVFSVLHAISAFTLFYLIKSLLNFFKFNHPFQIALLSSLLFFISPMAVETVSEKVNIHYFTATISILLGLLSLLKYFIHHKKRYLWLNILCFSVALFSLEISYTYPFVHLLFCFLFFSYTTDFKLENKFKLLSIAFYPFLLIICYLLLHKLLLGSFVGHYGSEVHLKMNLSEIFSTVFRYFLSYFAFFNYWDYNLKTKIYHITKTNAYWLIPLFTFMFAIFAIWINKKQPKNLKVFIVLFLSALFFLAPVSNLYYVDIVPIENDRYGYLFSAFLFPSIVFLFWTLCSSKKYFLYLILGIYVCFSIIHKTNTINWYNKSSKLTFGLYDSFIWQDKNVIILIDIDNFKGVKLFRTLGDMPISFSESLYLKTGVDRRKNIYSVFQMNYTSLTDSVYVNKIDSNKYEVSFKQWGNWIWNNRAHLIAKDVTLAHEKYIKTKLRADNLAFEFEIIDLPSDFVIIYPEGNKWKELEL